MINTSNFKTKTISLQRKNVMVEGSWGIALDIGYSAVKGISPNSVYSFPSYAKKIANDSIVFGTPAPTDIQYKDTLTGETWAVGAFAQDMIETDDSNDSIAGLYGRNRYFSPMFKVIARVGLALGMIKNEYGDPEGKNLVLQTGLPPAYVKQDTELLREALSGEHEFEVKIGGNPWRKFNFVLPEENIRVMPQPMGTLLSISTDNQGRLIPESKKYFGSKVLIFDPGFGTLDVFNISSRHVDSYETFDNLGMKRVIKETADGIFDKYKVEITIPAMQKFLQEGNITTFNRKEHKTKKEPFGDILEDASKKVCEEALQQICSIYNDLIDHQYFVITGGTGAAWKDTIKDFFAGMETLTVIEGNQNDNLPYIFSNVRGYYMYQYSKLKKAEAK